MSLSTVAARAAVTLRFRVPPGKAIFGARGLATLCLRGFGTTVPSAATTVALDLCPVVLAMPSPAALIRGQLLGSFLSRDSPLRDHETLSPT